MNKTTTSSVFTPTNRHIDILTALGWMYIARCDQLTRLYYSPRSVTHVRHLLYDLARDKKPEEKEKKQYVTHIPNNPDGKNARYIYTLDGAGVSFLKEAGIIPEERYYRPSDVDRSPLFVPHTLDLNDFMIAFEILAREDNRFQIVTRKHEYDFRRDKKAKAIKVRIHTVSGDTVVEKWIELKPDGFELLSVLGDDGKIRKSGIWLETDRGRNTDDAKFRNKIRAICEYYFTRTIGENGKKLLKPSDDYIQTFGTTSLTVAYLITKGGIPRMEHLRDVAQKELASTNERATVARIFRFAVAPPSWDYLDPATKTGKPIDVVKQLLLSPVWHVPYEGHELLPLIRTSYSQVE